MKTNTVVFEQKQIGRRIKVEVISLIKWKSSCALEATWHMIQAAWSMRAIGYLMLMDPVMKNNAFSLLKKGT